MKRLTLILATLAISFTMMAQQSMIDSYFKKYALIMIFKDFQEFFFQ